jgi:hypothetical protein
MKVRSVGVRRVWDFMLCACVNEVTVVTLKLCGDRKSLYSLYERHPTCAA